MKKFFFKVLLPVVIIVVSVLIGGEYYLRSLPNDFKEKRQYLENNASSLKLIVLGASSASMGIKPSYFDIQPAYNFAYASQSMDYDYWILNKCFDRMDSLQWVVIDLNFARPWSSKNTNILNYNMYYHLYWDYPYDNNNDVFSRDYEITGGFNKIFHRLNPQDNKQALRTIESDGYQIALFDDVPYDKDSWEQSALWNIKHHYVLSDKDANKRYKHVVGLYCKMIEMCQSKNVQVALVSPPTMPMFYERFDSIQLDIVHRLGDSLATVYPNVCFLDYLKGEGIFTVDEMYNPTHLNPRGAKKFTLMLNDTLKTIKRE